MKKQFVAATVAALSVAAVNVSVEAKDVQAEEKWVIQYETAPPQQRVKQLATVAKQVSPTTWTVLKQDLTEDVLQSLKEDDNVKFIERVQMRRAHQLSNSRDLWDYKALGLPQFTAPSTSEEAIVVAVIDSGVDATHPYLAGRVLQGYNTFDSSSDTADSTGHGTHVAGIVARATENYDVNILPVVVLNEDEFGASYQIAEGIRWAADQGAHVINLSFGGPTKTKIEQEAIQYARDKGILVVTSAGNDGTDAHLTYPASERDILTIGAANEQQELASFSNYGNVIDVVAPGDNILSTIPESLDIYDEGQDGYAVDSGTSMSAPFVAGVLATLKAAYPDVSNTTLEVLLKHYAKDLGEIGFDATFGFGHVNVEDFLVEAESLIIQTTEVEAAEPVIRVDVANATTGDLVLLVGDERYEQPITENEQTYTFTLSPVQQPFEVTAQIERAVDVAVTKTQSIALQPKAYTVYVQNEHKDPNPLFLNVSFYGIKDGEISYVYADNIYEDDDVKYMLFGEDQYDEVYAVIEADNARYVRKVGDDATITATPENLVPVRLKNSYATPSATSFQMHYLYPRINETLLKVPFSFRNNEVNTFIEKGTYHWTAIDEQDEVRALLTQPNIDVQSTVQLKNPSFDMAHYSDVVSVQFNVDVDEGEEEQFTSWLAIENELTGDMLQFSQYETIPFVLTSGSYALEYHLVDGETYEELQTYSETITLEEDVLLNIRGTATPNEIDITFTQEPSVWNGYRAALLPDRQWLQWELTPVYALHPWTIELSEPVDEQTINDNVYVRSAFGFPVDVTLRLLNDNKTILVVPNEKYVANGIYEIIVDEGLTSVDGKTLKEPVRATFTTK